jgi:hypothetical protein
MLNGAMPRRPRLDRTGYELLVEDKFRGPDLDERIWLPHYLPHWSSRERSAARYRFGEGLELLIERDQIPWNPEVDGHLRVSSIQTGAYAGEVGSTEGQHRFKPDLVVREAQANVRLLAPRYGIVECRARAVADPVNMVALWMIGYEDEPQRSGEICVFEIFGRDVGVNGALVGMGIHPFSDPSLVDDFGREPVSADVRESHTYAVRWTPEDVSFYVDDALVKVVPQSPAYPMQIMLSIYEFAEGPEPASPPDAYPKVFAVDFVRVWSEVAGS